MTVWLQKTCIYCIGVGPTHLCLLSLDKRGRESYSPVVLKSHVLDGLAQVQRAAVYRLARDNAANAVASDRQKVLDVLHRVDAPGGDDRDPERLRQGLGRLDVRAGEHAVTFDVRVDDGDDTEL